MKLEMSIFRKLHTQSISKQDVDNIKKDLEETVIKLERDLNFWKREFKKRQPTKPCTSCKQPISLWPFEDTGYFIKSNRVTHIECNKPLQ